MSPIMLLEFLMESRVNFHTVLVEVDDVKTVRRKGDPRRTGELVVDGLAVDDDIEEDEALVTPDCV